MAKVKITLNDGSTKIVQLDDNFTDADIEEVTNSLNSSLDLQGQGTEKSPFRLAVEKVAEPWIDYEKGIVQGLTSLPNALAKKGANKLRPLIGKKPLTDEELAQATWLYDKPNTFTGNLGHMVGSVAPTLLLPEVKALQGTGKVTQALAQVGNRALTGGYQGGLIGGTESLANEGDLSGVVPGAVGGTVLNTGLPVAGNLVEKSIKLLPMAGGFMGRALGRIQPETLKQAVKPNSIALDLDRANAENLLMNTTERVQQTYKDLLTKRGKTVREAIKALPTDKGISRKELKQILNDIYDSYSDSGNPNLNVAKNESADLYKYANNLIDKSKRKIVNAQEVKEILKNIQKHAPKNVFGRIASDTDDQIYKQLYGNYNSKLSELSPELAQANKGYAELKNFAENEGVSGILYPKELNPAKKLDSASRTLRNYNSTVTSGNKNRNIQDLENLFVKEGYEPFLNQVDDVNAAMDLLNARTTGDSWLANIATQATRPALKLARYANRKGLPQAYERLKRALPQNFVPVVYGIKELIDRD